MGSSLPHLHQDWAHSSHICTGTGFALPHLKPGLGSSAPGLGSPLPHPHQDWTRPPTSDPGLGSPLCTVRLPTELARLVRVGMLPRTASEVVYSWAEGRVVAVLCPEHRTPRIQHATDKCHIEHATCNRQQATEDRQQATGKVAAVLCPEHRARARARKHTHRRARARAQTPGRSP
jgi:hypothetical protein